MVTFEQGCVSKQLSMAAPAHERGMSLIERVSQIRTAGLPFASPKQPLRTTEALLVREVLQMLQGYPSNSFLWDESGQQFYFRKGIHVSHLSQSSLSQLLHRFVYAATSLRKIEAFVKRVANASCNAGPLYLQASPTLQAFASAVSLRLERLRKAAMDKELQAVGGGAGTTVTLLSLSASLSWVCAGAEFLEQVVNEAIPHGDILHEDGITAGELGAHILSFLYDKLSEFCLLQDGEEEPYATLLMLFAGSLRPLTESLDAWLHEGNLSDPFGELFFHANRSVAIEDAAFWQHGFHLRCSKSTNAVANQPSRNLSGVNQSTNFLNLTSHQDNFVCPNFLQPIAKAILSTGKSLQLLRYVRRETADDGDGSDSNNTLTSSSLLPSAGFRPFCHTSVKHQKLQEAQEANKNLCIEASKEVTFFDSFWHQWTLPASKGRGSTHLLAKSSESGNPCSSELEASEMEKGYCETSMAMLSVGKQTSFFAMKLEQHKPGENAWETHLNLARSCTLPPLNDDELREAIFTDSECANQPVEDFTSELGSHADKLHSKRCGGNDQKIISGPSSFLGGTDYGKGSGCGNLLARHAKLDSRAMESLFPFPTALPSSKEGMPLSDLLLAQQQNRVASRILDWMQKAELKVTPLPEVLVQECLIMFIQKQVEAVGKQVLNRLMGEWRLMEELAVLRAIYLIGSGDLLQQFSSVLFNKLDRGEPWDDFYELNTMLQESVRSSADGMLLPALDSLVVTVQTRSNSAAEQGSGPVPLHFMGRNLTFGIDTLDSLFFVYKVAWPLELIIDKNAIKKYNQVMTFLLKVKRAKFALDKACRWMWKNGAGDATNLKQQLLLQQKLMHFVNTLHQYVMDRVLYSAWVELCEGMASAGSLDEVIACHDAYQVSIQRQCLVAPDKLWALISSRVKTILGLALDFYSIQRTLCGGGAAPAIKARCQLEIDRVGRQFDECIVFLLRVLSFKLNVGHFPHLAELVTRINYNYYYVSESGHLLTPLPEISSGRGFQQGRMPIYSQN